MPTLILPPRYTPDTIAMRKAALAAGWEVERLSSWRVPDELVGRNVVLYGEPLFAAAVADALGVVLLEPALDWLAALVPDYRQREIWLTTLGDARRLKEPRFVKPADDKCFQAKVYDSGVQLPANAVIPDVTPVLVSEPVDWHVEFRCFVLGRSIVTLSPYWRDGALAEDESGQWSDPRGDEAREFAAAVVGDLAVALPPAVVVDVGLIAGRGWAVVEANAAWGSGIYGCDPAEVLTVVRRSCVPRGHVTIEDRRWIVARGDAVPPLGC